MAPPAAAAPVKFLGQPNKIIENQGKSGKIGGRAASAMAEVENFLSREKLLKTYFLLKKTLDLPTGYLPTG